MQASANAEARVKRVRFRAWRRGFKEADLMLGRFADAHAAALNADELAAFERLLEENDHDIYAWAVGAAEPPARLGPEMIARLKAFAGDGLARPGSSGA